MKRKSKMDVEYDRGYAAGHRAGIETTTDVEALKERYNYLLLGGKWQRRVVDCEDAYLAGFEDAMKTLGVKP